MPRRVGVGATREPHIVGVVRVRGETFLAVDDPRVAVARGARRQRGEVGARARLGCSRWKPAVRPRKIFGKNSARCASLPPLHQHWADGVHRNQRQRRTRAPGFIPKNKLLKMPAPLAAVLPSASRCRANRRAPMCCIASRNGGAAERVPLRVEPRAQVALRKKRAVVTAKLGTQRLLFGGESMCMGVRLLALTERKAWRSARAMSSTR